MRWRVEKEVVEGKGHFICGNKKCDEQRELRTWEVNFGYMEHGEKKNALVKLSKIHTVAVVEIASQMGGGNKSLGVLDLV